MCVRHGSLVAPGPAMHGYRFPGEFLFARFALPLATVRSEQQ